MSDVIFDHLDSNRNDVDVVDLGQRFKERFKVTVWPEYRDPESVYLPKEAARRLYEALGKVLNG